jgi:phenylacetate-CoA oxygenase PaaJ subunit
MSHENATGTGDDATRRAGRVTAEGTEEDVWNALESVEDPELPVSVVDLGLIYEVSVDDGRAAIDLTVTYSGCPGRDMIVSDVEQAVRDVDGIETVDVTIVYSPPWSVDCITDRGREQLSEFGLAVPGDESRTDPDCHT